MSPYSKELVQFIEKNRLKYTIKELCNMINKKFNKNLTPKHFRKYFYRHNLKYKRENDYDTNCTFSKPIGTESNKDKNGYVRVKVSKKQWIYKHRYLYEKYHNVKLSNDYVVVFLDGNKDNFNVDNLAAVPRSDVLTNKVYSKNKDVTKLALSVASLINKTREKEKEY